MADPDRSRAVIVDLFAGGGGVALGLRSLGLEATHVELDPDACATLRAAGFADVIEADVREWDVGLAPPWPVELLWASPPCQPFSAAGKRRGADDERNLWPATFEQIRRLRPTWAIAENVPGLTTDPYFWRVVVPTWRSLFPWTDEWELCSADYGTPQTRDRVFLVGGPRSRLPPRATHSEHPDRTGLPLWVSSGEALGLDGRVIGAGCPPHRSNAEHERNRRDITDEPAPTMTVAQVGNRGPWVEPPADWWNRESLPSKPSRSVGTRGNASIRLARPAPTVSSTRGGSGGDGSEPFLEALGRRTLTVEEVGVLQDFPADHPWQGRTKSSRYRQAGNAVPVRLARAVVAATLGIDLARRAS